MNCKQVHEQLHNYWQLDEENPLRIEMEAHMLECQQCAAKLDLETAAFPYLAYDEPTSPYSQVKTETMISNQVMKRIYEEESWFMPIATKRYQFSKNFRRNVFVMIASCLAMFTIALFTFIYDYYDHSSKSTHSPISGIVDVANAAVTTTAHSSSIYSSSIPVASISEPIMMQIVPTFPQYYVALSFFGIVLTLLVMSWFSRTRQ